MVDFSKLVAHMPYKWDGKACVRLLKKETSHWKQNEWQGFYFEHVARAFCVLNWEGGIGPRFGNTEFDYQSQGRVFDFKAHSSNAGPNAILNDVEAVNDCLEKYGYLGWIFACGEAVWDDDDSFKHWHNELKGKKSAYSKERERRGARSRRRKSGFLLQSIQLIEFYSVNQILKAVNEGVFTNNMQKGMRNSNGVERRSKYGVNFSKLTGSSIAQEGRYQIFRIDDAT